MGDDSTNARTITVSNASTNVTASSTTDAITFSLGTLTYTGTITGDNTVDDVLSLNTGANVSGGTITNVEALTLTSGHWSPYQHHKIRILQALSRRQAPELAGKKSPSAVMAQ